MKFILNLIFLFFSLTSAATDLKIGDAAPNFKAKIQNGSEFNLQSRKGQWTILYFFPKAATPGCTTQAKGFRDHIEQIRNLGADVWGVSTDSVKDQRAFHENERLNFNLIADEDGEVVKLYGSKMPIMNMSKRWTFLIDPNLKIRFIDHDVSPDADAEKIISELKKLNPKANLEKN